MVNSIEPRELRDMMVERGIEFASASEIAGWIGCNLQEVPHRLRGARQAREMVCVTRHGWVPTIGGRVAPSTFMEPMMKHLGHRYYMAGLSAAARHGASHQALMVDHYATDGHLSSRSIRGSKRVVMFHRPHITEFPTVEIQIRNRAGHACPLRISTPEVSLFDLFALHPFYGQDSNLNVACELLDPGPHLEPVLDPEALASVAMLYSVPTRQRVGFLLEEMAEHVGRDFDLDPLESTLGAAARTVEYEYDPDRSEPPIKHHDRWRVRQWYEMWPDL